MSEQTLKANITDDGLMQKIADLPKTVPFYPKDIIKEMEAEVPELTALEKDVLINGIAGNDFWDTEGCPDVWSDCIVDTCKVTTKEQISGVVSSLMKKGLTEVLHKGTSESTVKLTSQGLRVLEMIKPGDEQHEIPNPNN